jgi:hypothetical protein
MYVLFSIISGRGPAAMISWHIHMIHPQDHNHKIRTLASYFMASPKAAEAHSSVVMTDCAVSCKHSFDIHPTAQ